MKRTLAAMAMVVMLASLAGVASAQTVQKIGFVNVAVIREEWDRYVSFHNEVKSRIEKTKDGASRKVEAHNKEMKQFMEEAQNNYDIMGPEQKALIEEEFWRLKKRPLPNGVGSWRSLRPLNPLFPPLKAERSPVFEEPFWKRRRGLDFGGMRSSFDRKEHNC